jgi:hypothetical protein
MNQTDDDYLWAKSGAPDAEVKRLEDLLARYRFDPAGRPLELSEAEGVPVVPSTQLRPVQSTQPRTVQSTQLRTVHSPRTRAMRVAWTAAAAVLVAVGVAMWARERGDPSRGGYHVAGIDGRDRVHAGEEIATSDARGATLDLGRSGSVELEPRTRLRIERAEPEHHRFYLDRGSVHARVFAEARRFQIETPAGRSIDLGCEYKLDVGNDGVSVLQVLSGQVAFELDGREVYVPAGASCVSRKPRGPSAPVFDDAVADFKRALADVEASASPPPAALARLLTCDHDEALSVWHVFTSDAISDEVRRACYARLAQIFPQPADVTAEGLIRGDRAMREAWLESMKPRWRR